MTAKELLIQQFDACYNKDVWFVPLTGALRGLTSEQASVHNNGTNHSIRALVSHLIFWNQRYLTYLKGEIPSAKIENNDETFSDEKALINDLDWETAVKCLNNVMQEWRMLIEKTDDEKLAGRVTEGHDETWYSAISNANIHNAYHIGQIVTIRKQQGSWDPKLGVS